jgi:RNA polymerase sigma factor (sigma-70 family)
METVEDLVCAIRQAIVEDGPDGDRARGVKDRLWASCVDLVGGLAAEFAAGPGLSRDDLLGEGYLGFEQALARFAFDRGVPFRGYLHLCVRRRFIDLARKRVELTIDDADHLDDLSDEEAGAELRHKEVRAAIEATLAAVLPAASNRARMITAFRKRHLEGWSVAEIQAWLGVASPGQVSQWVHRVKDAFCAEFPRRYPEFFADLRQGGLELE